MTLHWTGTAGAAPVTHMVLRRATDPGFTTALADFPLGPAATSYTDTAVTQGTTYYYRVRAENEASNSAWSNTVSILVPRPVPTAPANLTARAYTPGFASSRDRSHLDREPGPGSHGVHHPGRDQPRIHHSHDFHGRPGDQEIHPDRTAPPHPLLHPDQVGQRARHLRVDNHHGHHTLMTRPCRAARPSRPPDRWRPLRRRASSRRDRGGAGGRGGRPADGIAAPCSRVGVTVVSPTL